MRSYFCYVETNVKGTPSNPTAPDEWTTITGGRWRRRRRAVCCCLGTICFYFRPDRLDTCRLLEVAFTVPSLSSLIAASQPWEICLFFFLFIHYQIKVLVVYFSLLRFHTLVFFCSVFVHWCLLRALVKCFSRKPTANINLAAPYHPLRSVCTDDATSHRQGDSDQPFISTFNYDLSFTFMSPILQITAKVVISMSYRGNEAKSSRTSYYAFRGDCVFYF